jgi:hypothetical protein
MLKLHGAIPAVLIAAPYAYALISGSEGSGFVTTLHITQWLLGVPLGFLWLLEKSHDQRTPGWLKLFALVTRYLMGVVFLLMGVGFFCTIVWPSALPLDLEVERPTTPAPVPVPWFAIVAGVSFSLIGLRLFLGRWRWKSEPSPESEPESPRT